MVKNPVSNENAPVFLIGSGASIGATVCIAVLVVLTMIAGPVPWQDIEAVKNAFLIPLWIHPIPNLLLAPIMVMVMTSIHFFAQRQKRVYSMLGIVFTSVYAAIIGMNSYIQLVVHRLNLTGIDAPTLTMLDSHSIFFALDALGCFFLGLGMLFASGVFAGGRLEHWIKGLFLLNGFLGIFGVGVVLWEQPLVIFTLQGVGYTLFILTTMLLTVLFIRQRKKLHRGEVLRRVI